MLNLQFQDQRNSAADIEERLRMEIRDTTEIGLPDDDANLVQLLEDARAWIRQAKQIYGIPESWPVYHL